MLNGIMPSSCQYEVYRLASYQSDKDFLRKLGMDDPSSVRQLQDFFRSSSVRGTDDDLLDAPFQASRLWRRKRQTRFSDGTFAVFYASLEIKTSEAEAMHWYKHDLTNVARGHPRYYWRFRCDFRGSAMDLRLNQDRWPALVDSDDYEFCNKLGAEAVGLGLDAFLTPSARLPSGTNVPVFAREALSNACRLDMVSLTFDPTAKTVTVAAAARSG